MNWNDIDLNNPPSKDKIVEVMDENGNVSTAYPTYYPFYIEHKEGDERKPWGWRGTPVFYENGVEKWDGGWNIVPDKGFKSNINGRIIKWREL